MGQTRRAVTEETKDRLAGDSELQARVRELRALVDAEKGERTADVQSAGDGESRKRCGSQGLHIERRNPSEAPPHFLLKTFQCIKTSENGVG